MTKYGICTIIANAINMLKTILALYTVHTTDLCNGYRTAIKRSDVNTTTSHTLIKLHIYRNKKQNINNKSHLITFGNNQY